MRKIYVILVFILIFYLPFGLLYYLISSGIISLFNKKTYLILILVLSLYFIIQELLKRLKKNKNE